MADSPITRDEVYARLKDYLIALFDIPEEDIALDAHLADDLDLDSIDAVDLMVKIQEFTGEKVPADDFKTVRTVGDVVDRVHALVN